MICNCSFLKMFFIIKKYTIYEHFRESDLKPVSSYIVTNGTSDLNNDAEIKEAGYKNDCEKSVHMDVDTYVFLCKYLDFNNIIFNKY